MNILIIGADGFIGKNLVTTLHNIRNNSNEGFGRCVHIDIYECGMDSDKDALKQYCKNADFVFHIVEEGYIKEPGYYINKYYNTTLSLIEYLRKYKNKCPVIMLASVLSDKENSIRLKKLVSDIKDLIVNYGKETDSGVCIYNIPQIFGKWCNPYIFYGIAGLCNSVINNLQYDIENIEDIIDVVYIDDAVNELINILNKTEINGINENCKVSDIYTVSIEEIINLLYSFKLSRTTIQIPNSLESSFEKKLYATYLSYLPEDKFSYPLKMNIDKRGSFTEIFRSPERGQFSVNISKPGIIKGEHWHHTKNEKFIVVSGNALIQLRKVGTNPDTKMEYPIINYHVSGDKIEVVDIPVGYTHNIINEGDTDLVTFMWANECFDQNNPDTYYMKVNGDNTNG